MKRARIISIALLAVPLAVVVAQWAAAPVAARDIYDPEQRRRPDRTRASEQTVNTPGTVRREGKLWVEEVTGSVTAAPRVRVELLQGNIELQGTAEPQISYVLRKKVSAGSEESARRMFAEYPLVVRRRGDQVELSLASSRGDGIQADMRVLVPKNTVAAELETRGGGIAAREMDGHLQAATAGGPIEADRIGGAAGLETAGGAITIGTVGGPIQARTAGGNIRLASTGSDADLATAGGNIDVAHVGRSVRAQTAGGNINIAKAGGDVTARTAGGVVTVGEAARVTAISAGGNIQVERAHALVRAQTAGGSVKLGQCGGPVRVETAAGTIHANIIAGRESWAESVLETSAGDVIVYLPADLALTIRAAIERATRRHTITSDFPLNVRSAGDAPGPQEVVAEGAINGGGASLRIRTVSGNIEIKKNK